MNERIIVASEITELQESVAFHRRRADKLAGEVEALKRRLEAADALAEVAEEMRDLLAEVSVLAYKPEIQDHLPYGLADKIKVWMKSADTDVALHRWQEANR